ncbi:hypothetical protein [Magnetospirillum aberrantis]|uniref:Uncharacterized protein n=1 Tax=Magnetospirillum aberrantis SpK TaxID=908842 RepID=A0A7C9UT93_9PROT|nr:hypothetical protein [Magnetospirillum aberrantis]NFV79426.1 hypothetical protein [Magnetospirillum aberrantis SpK]
MHLKRSWQSTPAALRLALSGMIAGAFGGVVLVGLVLVLDIARLRSLLSTAALPPSPLEWLTVPGAFAMIGLAVALSWGGTDG